MDIQQHIRDVLAERGEDRGHQAEIQEEDVMEALKDKGLLKNLTQFFLTLCMVQ